MEGKKSWIETHFIMGERTYFKRPLSVLTRVLNGTSERAFNSVNEIFNYNYSIRLCAVK